MALDEKKPNPTIQIQTDDAIASGGGPGSAKSGSGSKVVSNDLQPLRASSPALSEHQFYLALPSAASGRRSCTSIAENAADGRHQFDEKAMIRSLEIMAKIVGFKKSFSTNDIVGIDRMKGRQSSLQRSQSDVHLVQVCDRLEFTSRLDPNSRSLSTWVAVGDTSVTTQLPSPQVGIL